MSYEDKNFDASRVLDLLRSLRAEGFACAQVTIGEITIAGIVDTKLISGPSDVTVSQPEPSTAADLYRKYGGKAYEDLMAQTDEERGE